jgi:hypothetical protein
MSDNSLLHNQNVLATLLTGTNCHTKQDALCEAVAERFLAIKDTEPFAERDHTHPECHFGYVYDGNRCEADSLGWRFRQSHGDFPTTAILEGLCDEQIAATFHEAAGAEHWYMYEKDWGYDEF